MEAIQSLSIPQLAFLVTSLSADQPQRPDGRSLTQFRRITYTKGVLAGCLGSVLLNWAGGAITVLVGVKGEISATTQVQTDAQGSRKRRRGGAGGSVTVSVDIVGERDDDTAAIQLSRALQELVLPQHISAAGSARHGLDLQALAVTHEKAWHLDVDVQVLSQDGSNLTPACACAVRLALLDTRIPKTRLGTGLAGNIEGRDATMGMQQDESETAQGTAPSQTQLDFTVDDDFDHAEPIPSAADVPLVVLAGVVGRHVLFDCDATEEQVLRARYLVSVSEKGAVVQVTSLGVKETRPGVLQSALGGSQPDQAQEDRSKAQTVAAIEQRGLGVDQVGRIVQEAVDVTREMYKALRANIEEPADLYDVL